MWMLIYMEFHFYVTHIYTGRNHIGLILIEIISEYSLDNPLQYSCLEISMDRRAYSPWGHKESDMTE